jgi:transcription elongation GreA/GreB family factor
MSRAFVKEDTGEGRYRIVGEDEADPAKGSLSYKDPAISAAMAKAPEG